MKPMSAASIRSSSISHGELAPVSLGAGEGEVRLGERFWWAEDCWGALLIPPRALGEGLTFPELEEPGLVRPTPIGATPSPTSSTTRLGEGCTGARAGALPAPALEEAEEPVRLLVLAKPSASPQSMTSSFSGLLASLRGLGGAGKGRLLALHTGLALTVLPPPPPTPPRSSVSSQD